MRMKIPAALALVHVLAYTCSAGFKDLMTLPTHRSDVIWDRTFGGNRPDKAYSVQETEDGGFIVAGTTESKGAGRYDAWLFKLRADGTLAWDKTFGGWGWDEARCIRKTSDRGFIVAGFNSSRPAGSWDAWVFKLASDGALVWEKIFGGERLDDRAYSVQQTTDGGYIVCGYTKNMGKGGSDAWVLRLAPDGALVWDRTFGGKGNDLARSILQTTDGGFILTGFTGSKGSGSRDAWILRLSGDGALVWDKTFGGRERDEAYSVEQTGDGGYIVVGYTSRGDRGPDAWVLKLTANGTLVWDKTFGGTKGDIAYSVVQTPDDGYMVAATTESKGAGRSDGWLLKLAADGALVWDKTFGGKDVDVAYSIQTTRDMGYVVVGWTFSGGFGSIDARILRLGEKPCSRRLKDRH